MGIKSQNELAWHNTLKSSSIIIKYIINHRDIIINSDNNDKRQNIISRLFYRLLRNLRAVYILSQVSINQGGDTFLKLPVGLLIRNCLLDCINGLYISRNGEEHCNDYIGLNNAKYVRSLFEQYEVYRDKVSHIFDDLTTRNAFILAIEDTYISELKIRNDNESNNKISNIEIFRPKNGTEIKKEYGKCNDRIKDLVDNLREDDRVGESIGTLYAYYKYFSQYEHFSQRGDGDSLSDFGEDNIKFEKVFDHINRSVEYIMETTFK